MSGTPACTLLLQSHSCTYTINWLKRYRSSVKQHMSADKWSILLLLFLFHVLCSLANCNGFNLPEMSVSLIRQLSFSLWNKGLRGGRETVREGGISVWLYD